MKKKKIILFLACLLFVGILGNTPVLADVGNSFSGGSSGGGGYSGGGFSGGGFGSFIYLGGMGGGFGFILMLLFLGFIMYSRSKGMSRGGKNVPYQGTQTFRSVNEPEAVASLQTIDPAFSADKFKTYVGEVFIEVQEAWEARDWKKVRAFESNALFNTHSRQIQEYVNMKKTNCLNMQNIRNITIASFKQDGSQEIVTVKVEASLLDYVVDDETGDIVEGSKTQYQHRVYCLEFMRTAGVKTKDDKNMATTNCLNCGAPTQVTSSGECEYCHSVITTGEYGWVLNKYSAW